MTTIFLLFNHKLTPAQKEAAHTTLNVKQIANPSKDIRDLWSQIPADLANLFTYLTPVRQWLEKDAKSGDFLLVQGDFGATFLMVEFALKNHLRPIYSTTARIAIEKELDNGTIIIEHNFCHVRYREYGH